MPLPQIRLRKDALRKDGTAALYLQVIVDRKKIWTPLKLHIRPADWNEAKELVRASHPQSSDYNLLVDQARAKCTEILVRFRLSGETLDKEAFAAAWENPAGQECFLEFWHKEMYRAYQAGEIKPVTLSAHERHLGKLRAYLLTLKRKRLPYNLIGVELFARFDLWMVKQLEKGGHDGRGARWNCRKTVQKYLRLAKASGHVFTWPFVKANAEPPSISERVFLEEEELRCLVGLLEGENELITQARRIVLRGFLVQCFTGLRFSDLSALKLRDYQKGFIKVQPKKTQTTTGKRLNIPVSKPLRKLLAGEAIGEDRSYKFRGRSVPAGCLVPTLTEPGTNRQLKILARMAGIQKHVTTHVGRHTFATLFLQRGGSVEVLQGLLGHADLKTTMVYVHLTDERGRDQVSAAFDNF